MKSNKKKGVKLIKKKSIWILIAIVISTVFLLILTVPHKQKEQIVENIYVENKEIFTPTLEFETIVEIATVEIPKVTPTFLPTIIPSPAFSLTPKPTPNPTSTPKPIVSKEIYSDTVRLEIESIKIDTKIEAALPVKGKEGLDFSKIEEFPLWVSTTRNIGEEGVSLIIGHRNWNFKPKIFAKLDKLIIGNIIIVSTSQYSFRFVVKEIIIVDPNKVWDTIEKNDALAIINNHSVLTLLTCTPYGTDWQRLLIFSILEPTP